MKNIQYISIDVIKVCEKATQNNRLKTIKQDKPQVTSLKILLNFLLQIM